MRTLADIRRVTKLVEDIDDKLIDYTDETVQAIVESVVIFWELGVLNGGCVLGLIGQAYAAGRGRGRKESAMREMLEMGERGQE